MEQFVLLPLQLLDVEVAIYKQSEGTTRHSLNPIAGAGKEGREELPCWDVSRSNCEEPTGHTWHVPALVQHVFYLLLGDPRIPDVQKVLHV